MGQCFRIMRLRNKFQEETYCVQESDNQDEIYKANQKKENCLLNSEGPTKDNQIIIDSFLNKEQLQEIELESTKIEMNPKSRMMPANNGYINSSENKNFKFIWVIRNAIMG